MCVLVKGFLSSFLSASSVEWYGKGEHKIFCRTADAVSEHFNVLVLAQMTHG